MTIFPDSPYGFGEFSAGSSENPTFLAAAQGARLSWERIQIPWNVIETAPGVYDFTTTKVDETINAIYNAGLNIDFVIQGPPNWHRYTQVGPCASVFKPTIPADGAAFAKLILDRYPGKISAIECGNEDYSQFGLANAGCNDPTLAVPYLQATWQLCKPVYPGVLIGAPATLTGSYRSDPTQNFVPSWYTAFCNAGGTLWCDYVGVHYYSFSQDPLTPANGNVSFTQWWQAIRAAMQAANLAYGYPEVPAWITETGNTVPTQVDNATQSLYLQEELTDAMNSGFVSHLFYFDIHGLILDSGGVRPSYTMLQQFVQQYPQWPASSPPAAAAAGGGGPTVYARDGKLTAYARDGKFTAYSRN